MSDWSDIAIIVVPLLIAFAIYVLAFGGKGQSNPSAPPAQTPPLSSLPIVSITATNILLDSQLRLRPSARAMLQQISRTACVYVIVVVHDLGEMRAIHSQVAREFQNAIGDDHILYSQTALGRASMARQLEVAAHLDFDPEVIHQVSVFHSAVLIAREVSTQHAKAHAATFEQFVTTADHTIFPFLCV
jgi:hypothetical protein